MPTYTVAKVPGSSMWKVESNGREVSRHRTRSNAEAEARRLHDRYGGSVTVQGAGGQFTHRVE